MVKQTIPFKNIDDYIALQRLERRPPLEKFRQLIKKAAPNAEEVISYQMPAFAYNGTVLVYFAAFKNHYGFFPTSRPIEEFKNRLTAYKLSKGTIQLPLDKPLPAKLITDIVKFRIKQIQEKKTK